MTNLQSLAGGTVWIAVAAILMLITFEPVSIEKKQPTALGTTAEASATAPRAAA